MVAEAAFANSPWREAVEVIGSVDFRPQVRSWLLHRLPAGRLSLPIAVFRDALVEALKLPAPFVS